MKRNPILKMIVWLALGCCATAALAQQVRYNYDRDLDFSIYKTYQWVEGSGRLRDQLIDKDIRRAIDAELARKGLQTVESNGHLQIEYETVLDRERQVDVSTMGPRWSGLARANTSTIEVGTLILNVYDPAKKQVVWRGSATKSLDIKKDPDKNYKNLEKAVVKLLRNFPPSSKK